MDWYLIAIIVIIVVLLAYYAYCATHAETLNVSFSTFIDPRNKNAIRASLPKEMREIVDYVSMGTLGNFFIYRAPNEMSNACLLIPDTPNGGGIHGVNIAVFSRLKNRAHMFDHKLDPIVGVKDGALVSDNIYRSWVVRSIKMPKLRLPEQFLQFMPKAGKTITLQDAKTFKLEWYTDDPQFRCTLYRNTHGPGGAIQEVSVPVNLRHISGYRNIFYSFEGSRGIYVVIIDNSAYVLNKKGELFINNEKYFSFDDKWAASAFSMQIRV